MHRPQTYTWIPSCAWLRRPAEKHLGGLRLDIRARVGNLLFERCSKETLLRYCPVVYHIEDASDQRFHAEDLKWLAMTHGAGGLDIRFNVAASADNLARAMTELTLLQFALDDENRRIRPSGW